MKVIHIHLTFEKIIIILVRLTIFLLIPFCNNNVHVHVCENGASKKSVRKGKEYPKLLYCAIILTVLLCKFQLHY